MRTVLNQEVKTPLMSPQEDATEKAECSLPRVWAGRLDMVRTAVVPKVAAPSEAVLQLYKSTEQLQ